MGGEKLQNAWRVWHTGLVQVPPNLHPLLVSFRLFFLNPALISILGLVWPFSSPSSAGSPFSNPIGWSSPGKASSQSRNDEICEMMEWPEILVTCFFDANIISPTPSFHVWRPVTCLFYYPLSPQTGFHFLMNLYFLYNYRWVLCIIVNGSLWSSTSTFAVWD